MDYDAIVIGSGFGGSVSALRLAEKGYRVLVLEKGRRFKSSDFATSNRELKRWLWAPRFGWSGPMKMTFLPHVTALSGVGVGGGSLVYANTLPRPTLTFFQSPNWSHLADWERELAPHYETASQMLGANRNRLPGDADEALRETARELGLESDFGLNEVAVYFGKPGVTVCDPYFQGTGPPRTGCVGCGGCMLGCRYGSKNTLDKNYLYLAEKNGARILPETQAHGIEPVDGGYRVCTGAQDFTARKVFLAAGVLGTVSLLLRMKKEVLPGLSPMLGRFVRTNSEALVSVTSTGSGKDYSKGLAIGSILKTDDDSHLEPVRYPEGSDFFRFFMMPFVKGQNMPVRLVRAALNLLSRPGEFLRAMTASDYARRTTILLHMRSLEGHLNLKLGRGFHTGLREGLVSEVSGSRPPISNTPEMLELAERFADTVGGVATGLVSEMLLGIPTTAHILGGCCMGSDREEGVIDKEHEVFGYPGLYVVDGSAVSANPGVNPALTITALAERALDKIPADGTRV